MRIKLDHAIKGTTILKLKYEGGCGHNDNGIISDGAHLNLDLIIPDKFSLPAYKLKIKDRKKDIHVYLKVNGISSEGIISGGFLIRGDDSAEIKILKR